MREKEMKSMSFLEEKLEQKLQRILVTNLIILLWWKELKNSGEKKIGWI